MTERRVPEGAAATETIGLCLVICTTVVHRTPASLGRYPPLGDRLEVCHTLPLLIMLRRSGNAMSGLIRCPQPAVSMAVVFDPDAGE